MKAIYSLNIHGILTGVNSSTFLYSEKHDKEICALYKCVFQMFSFHPVHVYLEVRFTEYSGLEPGTKDCRAFACCFVLFFLQFHLCN